MAVTSTQSIPLVRETQIFYRAPLTIALVNVILLTLWTAGLAPGLAHENGVLETLQLLLAAGAFATFTFAALEDDGPIGSAGTAIAAIAVIAILREIDVRKLVVPDWMMIWAHGPFRDTTVGVLLLLVFVYMWFKRDHFRGWFGLLFRRAAWPLWLSGALLLSSIAFDGEKIIVGAPGVLLEEIIELNGFMLLLVAGWRHCRLLTNWPRGEGNP